MKIIKYEKIKDGNYKVYMDNNINLVIHEDVILKNNLLFKKEIADELLNVLINDNDISKIYNRCVKYISVRLRSINEIREYMIRLGVDSLVIDKIIDKLINNNLLNDDIFARAFVKDKLNFTTMGPYRIEQELRRHRIDSNIIYKYINEIDYEFLELKINKQINKLIKSGKKKVNLRNKIYNNLLNLGYSSEFILNNLDKYDL